MSRNEQENRQFSTGTLIRRFLPYYRPYLPTLIFDLFCAALTTVCELALPMIVRAITNRAMSGAIDELTVGYILRIGLLYMALRIIDAAGNYYMQSVGHIMGSKLETDMRTDLFHHLQQLSFSYYS